MKTRLVNKYTIFNESSTEKIINENFRLCKCTFNKYSNGRYTIFICSENYNAKDKKEYQGEIIKIQPYWFMFDWEGFAEKLVNSGLGERYKYTVDEIINLKELKEFFKY